MQLRHSQLWLANGFLILVVGIAIFFSPLGVGTALNQEKDTPEILKAILSLEVTRADIAVVGSNPKRMLVRSFSSLRSHLEQQGWTWQDQLGAQVVYRKDEQPLNGSCGMYSRHYMICDLDQNP